MKYLFSIYLSGIIISYKGGNITSVHGNFAPTNAESMKKHCACYSPLNATTLLQLLIIHSKIVA